MSTGAANINVPNPRTPLEGEAIERLDAARMWKSFFEIDIKEQYFLTAPHRQRQISSRTQPGRTRWLDFPEVYTTLGFEVANDFVTEIVNTFMPEAQQWCERGKGAFVRDDVWDQVKDQVREQDMEIFRAIKASNFYAELPKSYRPDLAIGTTGMWIDVQQHNICCQAIPIREIEINLGPDGMIDDRFAIRWPRNKHVPWVLGPETWAKVPEQTKEAIVGMQVKPNERTQVVKGFWRIWDDETDEVYQYVVMVGALLVDSAVIKGEGCVPLIITRFGALSDWPWAIGPLYESLPDLRQADELQMRKMEALGRAIAPPISFPSDSYYNIEQGIEDGFAYPITAGTEGAIKPIYPAVDLEAGTFGMQEIEQRLRRLHYIDYPQQTGDTPPTLGQWLDEIARAQRRIGTPGMSYFREGPAQYFTRFKYILERRGTIKPIVRENGGLVATLPMNPAQRAAEQQEIAQTVQAIQICGQAFPEEFKMAVDGAQSIHNILEKMRVKLLAMRDPQHVTAAVQQLAKLMGGQAPTAPGAAVTGAAPQGGMPPMAASPQGGPGQ